MGEMTWGEQRYIDLIISELRKNMFYSIFLQQ